MNLWIALLFLLGMNNGNGMGNNGGCGCNGDCGCNGGCGCGDDNGCGGNDNMRPWGISGRDSRIDSCGADNVGNVSGRGCAACSGDDNESDDVSCGCMSQNGSREFPSF